MYHINVAKIKTQNTQTHPGGYKVARGRSLGAYSTCLGRLDLECCNLIQHGTISLLDMWHHLRQGTAFLSSSFLPLTAILVIILTEEHVAP